MKKLSLILMLATCIACNHIPEKTQLTKFTDDAYIELNNEIQVLNETLPTTKISIIRKWIGVGISDVVGAAVGYASGGGFLGGLYLGCKSSIIAYKTITVSFDNGDVLPLNPENEFEIGFNDNLFDQEEPSYQEGYYHNAVIRSLEAKYGTSFYNSNEEYLNNLIVAEIEDIYNCTMDASIPSNLNNENVVYDPNVCISYNEYINNICASYPSVSNEILILESILDGINNLTYSDNGYGYIERVFELIDQSDISLQSKNIIRAGASVGVNSKYLWNINE